MRSFGRQCRGQGKVFVQLVRHTATPLLDLGTPMATLTQQAQQVLQPTTQLSEAKRERLARALHAAIEAHQDIRTQSQRLTQGKKLSHGTIVNAYDPRIAPIMQGKSHCLAQCGRKPGILSEPTTGCIFAIRVPEGNPSDASDVLPLLEKVQAASDRVRPPHRLAIHALAGDRGVNDATLRQALHARGILTVGIPKTIAPISPEPSPEVILDLLNESGFNRQRTPYRVQLACACG